MYGRIARTGQAERFEQIAEGVDYHHIFDGYAFRVGAPELRRVAVLFKDITERKRSEDALARASVETDRWKRLYEAVVAYTPDLGYVFDQNHRFTYANQALLEMWGKTWDEAIGKNCLELGYEPWHAAMHDREIDEVIATKQSIRGEVPFNATYGRRIYDYIFFPVFDRNGNVDSVGGTTRDVTDRKRAEEALEQRSAQYGILLNQAPLGVFLVDGELRIREVNPVAQPVFGNVSNLIGRSLREVIGALWDDEYAQEVIAIFQRTLETGEAYHVPERGEYRKDRGVTEFYEWKIDRIPLPDGGFGVVCYFRDISLQVETRQKTLESEDRYRRLAERLESEVLARTSELEERNVEVVQQASALQDMTRSLMRVQDEERRHIARELHDSAGQTLAALGMILGTAKQQSEQGERQVDEAIGEALDLVRQLTQEIRTASYLLHPPLLDETGLAPALQWYLAGLRERSGLEIELKMAEHFGRLPQVLELAVFRVVQESLTNIVRHSGSKTALIALETRRGSVAIKVEDRGKGMAPERLAQLRTNASGVGIRGMRERVRQLGGELRIESDGDGTVVLASLPILDNGCSKDKNGVETIGAAR
jgi:PAS domain S-box-containing protein